MVLISNVSIHDVHKVRCDGKINRVNTMTSDRFDRGQLLTTIETISWSKNSLNQLFTCLLISLVKRAKPLFSRNFCEKCVRENLCNFSIHTVAASQCGKTRNSLSSIFLSFNSLVTYLVNVKPLLSRNFCQKCVRENYRNFHTVMHSVESAEILSHTFFAKISRKQWFN